MIELWQVLFGWFLIAFAWFFFFAMSNFIVSKRKCFGMYLLSVIPISIMICVTGEYFIQFR